MLIHLFVFLKEFEFNTLLLARVFRLGSLFLISRKTVGFIESNNIRLKFLVVMDVKLQSLVCVFLEPSDKVTLSSHLFRQRLLFITETLCSHTQIFNNKHQVLVYAIEEIHFLLHFGCLLIQSLNGGLSGLDFTF
jgi:hypothetical protein